MTTFVNIIIATTTAFLFPLVSGDHIQEIDPPIPEARVIEVIDVPEEKPIPEKEITHEEIACNCYNLLLNHFREVPRMVEIFAAATTTLGNTAVFMYPPNEEWPEGIPHVAVVTSAAEETFEVEEYNYHECKYSTRTVSRDDVRLVGFINL